MMKKFIYLTEYSIKKKIKSKSFIITNIVLLILILLATNLDSIIGFFGGDFDEEYNIIVLDKTYNEYDTYDKFKTYFDKNKNNIFETSSNIEVKRTYKDIDLLKEELEHSKDILLVFANDIDNYINVSIITKGYINATVYQPIVDSINKIKYTIALENSSISSEEIDRLNETVSIDRIILDESKNSAEETVNTLVGVLFPIILLPFFLLILFLIQIIGGEINEEKTTRSMEIIISNVSAKTHLFSHLIADNVFIFFQALLISLYGGIGVIVKNILGSQNVISSRITEEITGTTGDIFSIIEASGLMDKLSYVVPVTIVLLLLSFFSYSFLAAVLASMSTNLEDYQQVQTPIMTMLLIGFYVSLMSSLFEGSIFIKILSFIPLISCLLTPTLLIVGQITIIDAIISIILMVIFVIITYKYGIRIYRVGILNYSSDKIWRRMLKAAKGK